MTRLFSWLLKSSKNKIQSQGPHPLKGAIALRGLTKARYANSAYGSPSRGTLANGRSCGAIFWAANGDCCLMGWQAMIEGLRRRDLVLTIRLARIGKKKKPFYRVVVIERTRPRNGRVKELVGTYDPLKKPAEIKLDAERIKYWLGVGAQPSDTVRSFLKLQKIA
jgi:small subunit ribosomal protein S16